MSKMGILSVLGVMTAAGSAADITFIHTGSGSGVIGGTTFNSTFTIVAQGDTANRQSFAGGWSIDHDTASIMIDGIGTFDILSGTRHFVNNAGQLVGFSRETTDGLDLFNGPFSGAFAGWAMTTSIGPIAGTGSLLQWTAGDIQTSGGTLDMNSGSSDSTFEAIVIPAPAGAALAGLGGLVALRRRR